MFGCPSGFEFGLCFNYQLVYYLWLLGFVIDLILLCWVWLSGFVMLFVCVVVYVCFESDCLIVLMSHVFVCTLLLLGFSLIWLFIVLIGFCRLFNGCLL